MNTAGTGYAAEPGASAVRVVSARRRLVGLTVLAVVVAAVGAAIALGPGGSGAPVAVQGRITEDGAGVADVRVMLLYEGTAEHSPSEDSKPGERVVVPTVAGATTDDDGRFTLRWAPADDDTFINLQVVVARPGILPCGLPREVRGGEWRGEAPTLQLSEAGCVNSADAMDREVARTEG